MNRFRHILNVPNLFLFVSAILFVTGIYLLTHTFGKLTDLVYHKGIIQDKKLVVSYYYRNRNTGKTDTILNFRFTVNGNLKEYNVSWLPKKMNNLLEITDTVEFYTKPVISRFGNPVSNGWGRWTTTHSDNEVYCLVCHKYESPLVDFDEYNRNMRTGAYVCFSFSLLSVFGYFFKRYGW